MSEGDLEGRIRTVSWLPDFDSRAELRALQLRSLEGLVAALSHGNRFYGPRLRELFPHGMVGSLENFLERMPMTTKSEIVADQSLHPPYGTNLTYPLDRYVRFHQTSGTTGRPLRWLDTAESWKWMMDAWQRVFRAAGIGQRDRVFFPFSFGPFLGFWTAFDAACDLGCLTISGGAAGTAERVRMLIEESATAICCTPTYALHLAKVADREGVDLTRSSVEKIVVAGEPGGSLETVRRSIADAWHGASVHDHHGMTEIGPVTYPNPDISGVLHVIETSYLAEIVDPESGTPVAPGEAGELILTNLGRLGSPLLRYRTGDLVKASTRPRSELGSCELALEGGILDRIDDMVIVRGINVYPSAVHRIIRGVPGVGEYRVHLTRGASSAEIRVEVEPLGGGQSPRALMLELEASFRHSLRLRAKVEIVAAGSLPRFELKAKRWIVDSA